MFSALWKRAPVAKSPDLRDEFVTFASRTAPLVIKNKKRKDREVERIILERLESLAHKRENTANKDTDKLVKDILKERNDEHGLLQDISRDQFVYIKMLIHTDAGLV